MNSAVLCAVISCQHQDKSTELPYPDIEQVSVATGGCYGQCPFLAVEINRDLTCKYYGGEFSSPTGFFTGRINQELWDSLNTGLVGADFISYTQPDINMVDGMYFELVLEYQDSAYRYMIPDVYLPPQGDTISAREQQEARMLASLHWVVRRVSHSQLVRVPDTLEFKTRIQYEHLPPPPILSETGS